MPHADRFTALYSWHLSQNAHMGTFNGYTMPLWYPTGAKHEHQAVITHAGLFDTSHMATLDLKGDDAFQLLQDCFSRDLRACMGKNKAPLHPGRSVYGVFLDHQGLLIDDAIVFHLVPNHYLIVVNAGMGPTIARHLRDHKRKFRVTLQERTAEWGKIDLQGLQAAKILARVLKNPQAVFDHFPYFSFKGYPDETQSPTPPVTLSHGVPLLLSRTGYTGEFGFEMFIRQEQVQPLWEMVLHAGRDLGVTACGLAARDSLRTGAMLPLSHKDVGPWPFVNNPWLFALPHNERGDGFSKDFVGSEALKSAPASFTYAFAGFDPRKIEAESGQVYVEGTDDACGRALSCTTDMAIDRANDRIYSLNSPDKPMDFRPRGLCCGFLKVDRYLPLGTMITIKDNRRRIRAEIVNQIRPDRTALRPIQEML